MKKTNSMRVAVAMLALTLITSCFVGGTFAKYTTSASGGDTARVAKFGVKVGVGEDIFNASYDRTEELKTDANFSLSVDSKDGNVVAPGTEGEMTLFTISGTPEVAVRINAEMSKIESIFLKINPVVTFTVNVEEWEAIYIDLPVGGKPTVRPIPTDQEELERLYNEREEDLANDPWLEGNAIKRDETPGIEYYPIKWTLKKGNEAVVADKSLADIKDYIDNNINIECAPGTDLSTISGTYTLAWKWAFEGGNDKYDTALGNFAANIPDSNYNAHNLTEAFNLSVTVTQID